MIWKSEKLGAAGTWLSGGTPSKKESALWAGDIPWVSPKDMKRLRIRDAIDHVSVAALKNGTQLAPIGSLLMVVRGMILAHTFPAALVQHPVAFNQDIKALVPSASFDSEFLLSWLQSKAQDVLRLVDVANHGTKRLPSERLFDLDLVCPPLPEQRKIAAILSSMDDTIEASRTVIDQLQVVKKSMMAELLTKGLPGRHKKFKQTEIGVLPEDWVVAKLGDLADIAYGLTVNGQRRNSATHLPYLTVANLQDDQFDLAEVKQIGVLDGDEERYAVRQGDVLLVEGNANIERLGRAAIWTGQLPLALHQNHLIRVRVGQAALTPAWAHLVLGACAVREQIESHAKTSSGLNTINSTVVAGLTVAVPSPEEQVAICDIRGGIQARLMAESVSMIALRAVKSALMSVLLTGEVRVQLDEDAT